MKKIVLCLMATCLSLTLLPLASSAQKNESPSSSVVVPKTAEREEIKTMRQDLNQSTSQNQSKINSTKKNKSQDVVISSNHHRQGGIYLSVGGAILIIFLIIILL